jgi:hypothetical protein
MAFVIFCQVCFCATSSATGPFESFSLQAPVVPFSNSVSNPANRPNAERPPPKPVVISLVTIEQLQQWLVASRGASDSKLAEQLSRLELDEQLGSQKLAQMTAELHGKKARQALKAIADISEFLDPPTTELPPDSATQRQMISLAQSYLRARSPDCQTSLRLEPS